MPKISVIIPLYNAEQYLRTCLESILAQTLQDIEILCINDGSTDASAAILQEYARQDSRILVKAQTNRGAGSSRNRALSLAKGQFVCFMDADDCYPAKDILETLYTKAIQHNVVICGGEFSCFTENPAELFQPYFGSLAGYLFAKSTLMHYQDYQFDYGFHRFIYNRAFLIRHGIVFPPYERFQDPPFFVQAMLTAKTFFAVKKISYAYRTPTQTIIWTEKKLNDFLHGVLDNMRYACQYNYYYLGQYTFGRLYEYRILAQKLTCEQRTLITTISALHASLLEKNTVLHKRSRYKFLLWRLGEKCFPQHSARRTFLKTFLSGNALFRHVAKRIT